MKSQARCDRRGPQRYPTFGAAFVFTDNGGMVECIVRDVSEGGACLHGPAISGLPPRFEVWLPTEGVSGLARITWRNRHACGIFFEDEAARSALSQRIARWEREGDRTDRMVAMLRAAKERMSVSPAAITAPAPSKPSNQAKSEETVGGTGLDWRERPPGIPLRGNQDSVDCIATLVRSRLVKTVLQGRSTDTEADILRKILSELNLLRRLDASHTIPSAKFGRK